MKKLLIVLALVLTMGVFALPTSAFATGDVTINLTYTGPGGVIEGDFAGYKIYKDGMLVHTIDSPTGVAQWVHADLPDPPVEGYVYRAVTFDTDGNPGVEGTATAFWQTWPGGPAGSVHMELIIDSRD